MLVKQSFINLVLLSIIPFGAVGQDLVKVAPVTNKILMIEYNEGHIDYNVFGNEAGNVVYYNTLNVSTAGNTSNYSIGSSNDANYSSAKQPISIGRKSKSYEFNRAGGIPPYILRHYIYIELPNAMQRGKSYTLTLNNLAANRNQFSFVYEEKDLWSPTVHVNQVGFVSNGVKYAYLSQWMGTFNNTTHSNGALNLSGFSATQFRLVRLSDNQIVFSGPISKQAEKGTQELTNGNFATTPNSTKADVWQCDFTSYTTPGTYKVAVDGIGSSYPFEIGSDVYRQPFNRVMKAIFTQRQGVDKELEGGQVYPRGHTNVTYVGTSTPVNVYGYYYDAGDWDGHNRHIGVPLDLMLLYDLKPNNFRDGDVSNRFRVTSSSSWINEGADGLPDILNEARWLLDFYKRAKNALIAISKGTGGVPGGRLPNEEGLIGPDAGAENRASWTDTRAVHINAEQTENTYNYAAAAAYYAICLQKFYGVSSNTEINSWRNEATSAFSWADGRSDDEATEDARRTKQLAAAVLYRLTGTSSYQSDYKRLLVGDTQYPTHEAWQNPWPWQYAAMIYGLTPDGTPNLDVTHRTTMRNAIIDKANNDEATGESRGMRMSFPKGRMGSNGAFSTPRVYFLAFAHNITGDAKYLRTIQNTTSFTLGGNQDNMTYVAQLGHNPDNMTFHPDSWRLLDRNSKVYKGTSLPGYVNYYGMQNCDFFGCGWSWTVDEDFSRSAAFPNIDSWPAGEWRMNNKYSIAGSEFTMNESLGPAAFAYGYLTAANPSGAFTTNPRPVVTLNLNENQNYRKEGCDLTVTASSDTWKVEYYYDWHYIGESVDKANNFKFFWAPPLANGATTKITAVAIDAKGLISNPSPTGERNVTITSGASCAATPTVAVAGVTLNPTTTSIAVGGTQQLTATVAPSNATNKNVTWSTSNSAIATVTSSGLVTGVAAGTATITVTTQDGAKTATSAITVTAGSTPVTGVTVSPTSASIAVGGTQQLTATVAPSSATNKTVTWSSSNNSIATVNSTGLVTGVAAGTATITVTTQDGAKTATSSITVSTSTSSCTAYQAENYSAQRDVVVATNQSNYTGTGFVDYGGQNSYAQWTVSAPSSGTYTFKFRYANGSVGNRQCALTANGSTVGNLTFGPTSNWETWNVQEVTVTLNSGNNIIRLTANTSNGGPNLDKYDVCSQNAPQNVTITPVEDTYARSDNSSTVLGNTNAGELNLRYASVGGANESIRYTYLKFQIPSGQSISSAKLELYAYNTYNSSQNTVIAIQQAGNSWTEGSLTWNNKPSFLNFGSVTFNYPLLNATAGVFEVDVTSLVSSSAGQTITLALRINAYVNDALIKFASKENTTGHSGPKLKLTYGSGSARLVATRETLTLTDGDRGTFEVYPNPLNDEDLKVSIRNLTEKEKLGISLYDLNGRLIFNQTATAVSGSVDLTVKKSSFKTNGVYFIRLQGKSIDKRAKVIVK